MRALRYAADVLDAMRADAPEAYAALCEKVELAPDEPAQWRHIADNMYIPETPNHLFEQHDGFFELPHTDINSIPVSEFMDLPDGTMPQGTSKYEKRGIAVNIPVWDSEKCIQCNMCSYVCPHSCIRPFLVNEDEAAKAPETFTTTAVKGRRLTFPFTGIRS